MSTHTHDDPAPPLARSPARAPAGRGAVTLGPASSPLATPEPARLDTLTGVCRAIVSSFASPTADPGEWLTSLADVLGGSVGADAGVTAMILAGPTGWRPDHVAGTPNYPEPARQAVRDEGGVRWPTPDDPDACAPALPVVEPIVITDADAPARLPASSVWSASRRRHGLHTMVRAAAPLESPAGARALVVQVDGLRPAWGPTPALCVGLRAAVEGAAWAFASRFTAGERHRRQILGCLSERQRELLPMLIEGDSEAVIARRIGRSVHTIHDHTKRIYRRLGVSSRFELRDLWFARDEAKAPGPA